MWQTMCSCAARAGVRRAMVVVPARRGVRRTALLMASSGAGLYYYADNGPSVARAGISEALRVESSSSSSGSSTQIDARTHPGSVTHALLLPLHVSIRIVRAGREFLLTALRVLQLATYFAPTLAAAPWAAVWPQRFSGLFNRCLLWSLEQSGPTFIKLGQWASTRPDIFPRETTDVLGKLHRGVDPHSYEHTVREVERVFGRRMDDVFATFSAEPVGSGCIAQVYEGTLSDPERTPVAVKVRHPGMEATIRRDLALMNLGATVLSYIPTVEWLSFCESAEQFGAFMQSQLDMRCEARNLAKFRANFRGDKHVDFPDPYFASEEILVESFEEGIPVSFFLETRDRKGAKSIHKHIAETGLKAFLQMLITDNFIHSDLHPGNILVKFRSSSDARKSISRTSELASYVNKYIPADANFLQEIMRGGFEPQVIMLDAGLVTELDPLNRANFLDLFRAVAEGQGSTAARLMVDRSKTRSCRDQAGFERQMAGLIDGLQKKTFQLASIKIGDTLQQVMSMVRRHRVKIEADFTNLVVSIMVLEGLGRQLDPNLDLFAAALPTLRRVHAGNVMTYAQNHGLLLRIWAYAETRDLARRYDEDYLMDNVPQWPGLLTV